MEKQVIVSLMRNIILNKMLPDKEIFTMYSYFPGAHSCTVGWALHYKP
jgi:hypothetical protein